MANKSAKVARRRPLFGLSSFLSCSFRDLGCGKAMSFDDSFRKDRPDKSTGLESEV
jgi:hypothetical protein